MDGLISVTEQLAIDIKYSLERIEKAELEEDISAKLENLTQFFTGENNYSKLYTWLYQGLAEIKKSKKILSKAAKSKEELKVFKHTFVNHRKKMLTKKLSDSKMQIMFGKDDASKAFYELERHYKNVSFFQKARQIEDLYPKLTNVYKLLELRVYELEDKILSFQQKAQKLRFSLSPDAFKKFAEDSSQEDDKDIIQLKDDDILDLSEVDNALARSNKYIATRKKEKGGDLTEEEIALTKSEVVTINSIWENFQYYHQVLSSSEATIKSLFKPIYITLRNMENALNEYIKAITPILKDTNSCMNKLKKVFYGTIDKHDAWDSREAIEKIFLNKAGISIGDAIDKVTAKRRKYDIINLELIEKIESLSNIEEDINSNPIDAKDYELNNEPNNDNDIPMSKPMVKDIQSLNSIIFQFIKTANFLNYNN